MRLNGSAAVLPIGVACVAYCVPTYSVSAPDSATSSINAIPLELHSPNEPVLNAKINDIEMSLSFAKVSRRWCECSRRCRH